MNAEGADEVLSECVLSKRTSVPQTQGDWQSSSGACGNVDRAHRRRGPQLLPSGRRDCPLPSPD